jgi:hypothetical protein
MGATSREVKRAWAARNRESESARTRRWFEGLKAEAFAAYGNVCACCGEARREFLTIDHVNGRGEHKGLQTRQVLIRLRREGWPPTCRLLCWNCNCARGAFGYCPHEREREEAAA